MIKISDISARAFMDEQEAADLAAFVGGTKRGSNKNITDMRINFCLIRIIPMISFWIEVKQKAVAIR